MTTAHPITERRQLERFPILLEATVSFEDDVINCVIFDLSAEGAKVQLKRTEVHLDDDQVKPIVLNIPEFGDFEGEIFWTDDEYIGIKFHDHYKTVVKLVLESATKKTS